MHAVVTFSMDILTKNQVCSTAKKERKMLEFLVKIRHLLSLLLLLCFLPKNKEATSPVSSSCEATDPTSHPASCDGRSTWQQMEEKVDQAVAGVAREVLRATNHKFQTIMTNY